MADVIQAQYVGLRTMANGCVRITFDAPIENLPRVVDLFRKEGDPAAIARLTDDVQESTEPDARRKWEELPPTQQAGIRCGERMFVGYITDRMGRHGIDPAEWIRASCNVDSRSELNTNADAAEIWANIERNYQAWLTTQKYEGARR